MTEARDQLQKLTECCICFKTFSDPRMLPCIHTFCLECLKQTGEAAKKEPGEKMPCPLCRNMLVIPAEGMNGLQKNFFMRHLMDVTTLQLGHKPVIDCDICKVLHEGDKEKTKKATMRCLECGDNFCEMCSKTHKLHKSSKTHNIVEIGGETEEDIRKMQPKRNCTVHNQQQLNFYCSDCKKIICVSCFVENHASHKCKDVTTVEKEFRRTIEINALKISNCAGEMLSKVRQEEQRKTEILLNLAETEDKILKRNLELKEMIDRDTNFLLNQLSLIKQKQVKDIAIDKEEIERMHTILTSFETYCTELISKGSASDVCSCVDELVTRAKELETDHKAFIVRPYKKTDVSFKTTDLGDLLSTPKGNIVGQIQEARSHQGLSNFGNTCYFNAVIQCLYQTFPLLEDLSSKNTTQQPLTEAFVRFWNHRCKGSPEQNEAFSKFLKQLFTSSPKFNNHQQHDSHDLFIHFLNDLRSEERLNTAQNIDPRKILTTVDKVFGGHFITMYACLKCAQPYFVCECLLDISLPICIPEQQQKQQQQRPYSGGGTYQMSGKRLRGSTVDRRQQLSKTTSYSHQDKGLARVLLEALNEEPRIPEDGGGRYHTKSVTLTECLRFYTATEHIPEGYLCVSCQDGNQSAAPFNAQTMPPALKRTLIYNPPAVLVLHMKRFERSATGFTKRSDRVSYEELLDLGPYCSSDCLRIDPEDKNVWYSLYGVVVHSGSMDCGHYTAFVKVGDSNAKATKTFLQKNFLERDQVAIEQEIKLAMSGGKRADRKVEWQPIPATDEKWIRVSDTNTSDVTSQEALNQEAFMLFYERVPKHGQ